MVKSSYKDNKAIQYFFLNPHNDYYRQKNLILLPIDSETEAQKSLIQRHLNDCQSWIEKAQS